MTPRAAISVTELLLGQYARIRLAAAGHHTITVIGNPECLARPLLGLVCSVQSPGSVIAKAFDAIREIRDAGIVVTGGFHSPMERECLDFLMRGQQPVIVCPATGLGRSRMPADWREAIESEHLLLVSPFPDSAHRITKSLAQ